MNPKIIGAVAATLLTNNQSVYLQSFNREIERIDQLAEDAVREAINHLRRVDDTGVVSRLRRKIRDIERREQ